MELAGGLHDSVGLAIDDDDDNCQAKRWPALRSAVIRDHGADVTNYRPFSHPICVSPHARLNENSDLFGPYTVAWQKWVMSVL